MISPASQKTGMEFADLILIDDSCKGGPTHMMCDETNGNLQVVTDRERKIIKLMAEGYKNKEIADELRINEKTVEENRVNLMRKFNARSTASVIEHALGTGLISVYDVLESRFSKRNPKRN